MAPLSSLVVTDAVGPAVPDAFLCAITQEIMAEPLMTRLGVSFERSAILQWIADHNCTCPLTRSPLCARDLVPNHALKASIAQWCQANGVKLHSLPAAPTDLTVFATCLASKAKRSRKRSNKRSTTRLTRRGLVGGPLLKR